MFLLQFIKLWRRLLGKRLFEKLMKSTFYGHFVAGEDAVRIRPLLERNMSFGVKSILDYSVEMDISTEEAKKAEIKCVYHLVALSNQTSVVLLAIYSINRGILEICFKIFVLCILINIWAIRSPFGRGWHKFL